MAESKLARKEFIVPFQLSATNNCVMNVWVPAANKRNSFDCMLESFLLNKPTNGDELDRLPRINGPRRKCKFAAIDAGMNQDYFVFWISQFNQSFFKCLAHYDNAIGIVRELVMQRLFFLRVRIERGITTAEINDQFAAHSLAL